MKNDPVKDEIGGRDASGLLAVLREATKHYPELRYVWGVVGIGAALAILNFWFSGNWRVITVGIMVLFVFMVLLWIFHSTKHVAFQVLIWLTTGIFSVSLLTTFSSAAFCVPERWSDFVLGTSCGVVKGLEVTAPTNGESVAAIVGDADGDSLIIAGRMRGSEVRAMRGVCVFMQSRADFHNDPPSVYLQKCTDDLDDDLWQITAWVGSNRNLIPRGNGSCVRQYRVIAIGVDEKQLADLKAIPNSEAIPWKTISKTIQAKKENYDEIGIGVYVPKIGLECQDPNLKP